MISLIKYEFKKLFSNIPLLILVVILLISNLYFVGKNISNDYVENEQGITNFVNDYTNDPVSTTNYMQHYISEYKRVVQIKQKDPNVQLSFPDNKYTSNDYNFFNDNVDDYIDYSEYYSKKIKNAIRVAQGHKYEYEEISKTDDSADFSFEITYQDQIINKYNELKEMEFPVVNIRGYDIVLFYNGIGVFSIISMVIGGIMILLPEYRNNTINIIRVTKNGRLKTIISKIIVAFIYCLIFCILINLSSLILINFRLGFDGGYAPIQMVQEPFVNNGERSFIFCPFNITVIGGLFLKIFLNFITSLVIIIITLCLATIFKSYILTFAFSLGYIGFNFVLGNYNFLNDYNYFKNANLFWAINGIEPIIYYRGINIFGFCIPTLKTILLTDLVLLFISIICIIVVFTKTYINIKNIKMPKILNIFKINHVQKANRPKSIFTYELKKVYSLFSIIIISVLLITNVGLSIFTYTKKPSNDEIIYSRYMTELEGEWTQEKSNYIENEYNTLSLTIASYSDMMKKYDKKEISAEEIANYLKKYYTATLSIDVVKNLVVKNMELRKIVSDGGKAYFVNENNWSLVYNNNFSYVYLFAIILILSNIYSIEYKDGNINPIQITKNYLKSVKCKIIITITSAVLILGINEFIQYLFILVFKGLSCSNATAHSITALSKYGEMSLGNLFTLLFFKQLLIIIAFALLVLLISKLTKKLISTLIISSIVAFAPTLFTYFGFDFMNNISLITLLGRS